jgi:hypothetical protein
VTKASARDLRTKSDMEEQDMPQISLVMKVMIQREEKENGVGELNLRVRRNTY